MHVYHVTDSRCRASIVEHRLLPRDTTLHNFPYPDSLADNAGVEAVYAHRRYSEALDWAAGHGMRGRESVDIWELDVSFAEVEADPCWSGAVRVRSRVDACSCTLVAVDLTREAARAPGDAWWHSDDETAALAAFSDVPF